MTKADDLTPTLAVAAALPVERGRDRTTSETNSDTLARMTRAWHDWLVAVLLDHLHTSSRLRR
jgi:hypothetical protein